MQKDYEKMKFADYALSCIKRMKAYKVDYLGLHHFDPNKKKGYVFGNVYLIEEYFSSQSELDFSGRREIYSGFEENSIKHYDDGSMSVSSLSFVYPKFMFDGEVVDYDPRFFAVANLYPYFFEKDPKYLKRYINDKYKEFATMDDNGNILEVGTKETTDFLVKFLEGAYHNALERGVFIPEFEKNPDKELLNYT